MSENFGLKIGLEGEKEFKKSLAEINNSFKVLGSEMKLVDSQFDKNDKSAEALTAPNQVLNKEIEQQKQKIVTAPHRGNRGTSHLSRRACGVQGRNHRSYDERHKAECGK